MYSALEFCGSQGVYGAAQWAEISPPNMGSSGHCTTPTRRMRWGDLKLIYR